MTTRQIPLQGDHTAKAAHVSDNNEINKALEELRIPHPRSVIVLVGCAWETCPASQFHLRKAVKIIARLAEETQSAVVDGGTQAGIMTEIGRQRKHNKFSFPLVGVVFDSLLMKREPQSILDPNHTHFFLIPGSNWGDESAWISKIATQIAGDKKSITVLVNGGQISRTDVGYSVLEDRPTFVMRGTGRMADEIMLADKIIAVDISQKPEAILELLKRKLV